MPLMHEPTYLSHLPNAFTFRSILTRRQKLRSSCCRRGQKSKWKEECIHLQILDPAR